MLNSLTSAIPQELQQLNSWVCWKYQDRKGKNSKVPCDPETGTPVNPINSLYSFEDACQYAERFSDTVNGIGFYFSGNGISGIDLDKCIDEEGKLSPAARTIIDKFNSYTELSPSGKGIHIIFKGTLPPGSKNRKDSYEVYSDKRFFTVTGDVFENKTTLESRQEELEWFLEKYIQPRTLSDSDEIINTIIRSKNADKFNKLMQGDISDYNNDDSAADAALMAILAFYYGKSRSLMADIFNKSKLADRPKWKERKDYRDRTIEFAIKQTTEVYKSAVLDDQKTSADIVLKEFGNPCGTFDTSVLPELLKSYVDQICQSTDADPIIVLTSLLGMISGFLKKSMYIPEDDYKKASWACYFQRLYPNLWILQVMKSGRYKTTAQNRGFRIAYQLKNKEEESIFLPQKNTVEGLLRDLNDLEGGVIVLSEIGSWLQDMEKQYNMGLKSLLTNLYDVPPIYTVSTKTDGRHTIERPYITIVGASTIEWVKDKNNIKDIKTGFWPRFLFFNPPSDKRRSSAMPVRRKGMDKEAEVKLMDILTNKIPEVPREYSLSMDAYNRFEDIHAALEDHLNDLPDYVQDQLEPFFQRWSPYILKIGMILQFVMDPDTSVIEIDAINSAYEIVKYAMRSTEYLLKHELTESKHQANCRKVLEYIANRTKKGLKTTWSNILQSHILENGGKDYECVVKDLSESGHINIKSAPNKKDWIYYLTTGEKVE